MLHRLDYIKKLQIDDELIKSSLWFVISGYKILNCDDKFCVYDVNDSNDSIGVTVFKNKNFYRNVIIPNITKIVLLNNDLEFLNLNRLIPSMRKFLLSVFDDEKIKRFRWYILERSYKAYTTFYNIEYENDYDFRDSVVAQSKINTVKFEDSEEVVVKRIQKPNLRRFNSNKD